MAGFQVVSRVRRSFTVVTAFTAISLVVALTGTAQQAQAAPIPAPRPAASPGPAVLNVQSVHPTFKAPPAKARDVAPTATMFPPASLSSVNLAPTSDGRRFGSATRAGNSPVSLRAVADRTGRYAGPAEADVHVLDQAAATAAGVDGVLVTIDATGQPAGGVDVAVDYSAFAQAYGGNYGQRLHLVRLPACAVTTPSVAACRLSTSTASKNTPAARTVSTQISLGGSSGFTVLAATATPSQEGGSAGTYAATELKPSGSWSGGGSSGSFTYSYPVSVPPSSSSLVPDVTLAYDSGSVDAQTATTQPQSSWVGDGWSSTSSYVEQSFASCADSPEGTASPVSTTDTCYDGPVLTLSLNGSTTALVWDSGKNTWRPAVDNGEVVKHVTNSGNGTGTYITDYWSLTTRDGTTYQFGRNQLPGWAAGKPATNSVDSEPVYSAHSGDPCYNASGFSASVCTMAYRWNLDYVTDVHGNAMSYYYLQDSNKYAQNKGATTGTYIRNSHLDHVDYGFTAGNAYGTVPNKVSFTTGPRCFSTGCDPLTSATKASWKDVPYDLVCASAPCTAQAPSFFSTVRLASIQTRQYSSATAAYVTVDSYALAQSMPDPGDGTSATLWLDSITRTGSGTGGGGSTTPITLPPVTFGQSPTSDLANRVDTVTDGLPALRRFRISSITTETGSVITPTYTLVDPCTGPVTLTPAGNTRSCFPVYWTPDGYIAPFLDWFNKYVVTKVTTTDPTGGAPAVATNYTYLGGAAWHFDDNEVVKAKYRTYGQYRGYGRVQTRDGDGVNDGGNQTLSETTYYRGMSQNNGGAAVTLTDSQSGTHDDNNQLAGEALETTNYLGNGGTVDNSTITSYWVSAATATRTRTGLPALTANWVAAAETYTRQALTSTGTTTWRITETDNTYVADVAAATVGLLTRSYSHTVPANAAYDRCTSNTYAAVNTTVNLIGLVADSETDAVACGTFVEGSPASVPAALNTLTAPATVNRPDQVVADTRTFYDDPAFVTTFPQASAPTKGDVTMTRNAATWSSGVFTYQTASKASYDSYGRTTGQWDANGNKTTTAYTMNTVGLTTATTTTNALTQASTVTLDPQRDLTLTVTDPNHVVTTVHYDPLGRTTSAWLHSRATTLAADQVFTYQLSNTGLTAVTTDTINAAGGYVRSTLIYDAMLRQRQTQAPTPQSGRMVTDTIYDSRGWVSATYNAWWDPATTPNTTLIAASPSSQVPNADILTYDGLGRVIRDDSQRYGLQVSTTTAVYNGDRTTTIPPQGGVTATTVTDPMGRTSELDQYTAAPTLNEPTNTFTGIRWVSGGTITATHYGFDAHGNQNTLTDALNHTWTSTYDLLGRVTSKNDPDAGTSSMVYDPNGNLTQTTDSRGKTISYTYDQLNRKTGQYDAPATAQTTANQLAAWVFDNANTVANVTNPIGQLTTATSYHGGAAYTTQASGFNVFGEPLGETITIPSATEGTVLGTSYTFSHVYNATTGLLLKDIYPNQGGLPGETVLHTYSGALDLPNGIGGTTGYAQTTTYDAYGRVNQETIGAAPNLAYITNQYDDHTGRLTDQLVTRAVATPANVDEQAYKYDLAGNITRQTGTRLGAAGPTETQCFTYDNLDRLTQAWTATDTCAATPTTTSHTTVGDSLGSASAYWTTWTYDVVGDRTSQTEHGFTGGSHTTDTVTTYTYNGNNTNQPHTLTSTTTTGATTSSTSSGYDPAGNMTSRTTPANGNQTLTWDDTDTLSTITGTAGTSTFLNGPDGNLLLQKDPGKTTLYLPGEQITLNTVTQAVTGVRYYPLPGGGTAVRTGSGTNYTFEITDQHGTPSVYLDNTAQQPTWRQYTPFGSARGQTITPPDNRGFLNKPENTATGLTQLGARNYDPIIGRFISIDPILDPADPQQWNGYAYANNNPISSSDPTGLRTDDQYYGSGGAQNREGCGYTGTCGHSGGGSSGGHHGGGGGHHGGGGGCGSANACEHHDDLAAGVLRKPTHPSKIIQKGMVERGYGGTKDFTVEDLLIFARQSTDNWNYVCTNMLQHDSMACDRENPFHASTKDQLKFGAIMVAGLAGGELCALYVVACAFLIKQAVVDQGEFAGTGNMLGALETGGLSSGARLLGDICSFTPDTGVLMADGSTKPIKDVEIGDEVASTDPSSGKTANKEVTAVHHNKDTDLADVIVADQRGKESVLHTTQNHPFWDVTTQSWTPAGALKRGELLLEPTGDRLQVALVKPLIMPRVMLNLTVADIHTYYVMAGNTPVLVHNTACIPTPAEAQDLVKSAEPVGSALKADGWHRSAAFVVDDIASRGTVFRITGGDGVDRTLIQMPGEVNGIPGRFEWIVDGSQLTHTMFVKNGTINGIPIKP